MQNPFKRFKSYYSDRDIENVFRLDGAVPLGKAIPLGVQHLLSMFVGNIAPILICFAIVGASAEVTDNALRSAILMAALGTLIQIFPIWRIGSKLPVVVGTSFTFLGVLSLIGATYGLGTMFISVIIGGLLIGILGLFADKWKKVIKPIVAAIAVLGVGLSLLSVGINDFLSTNVDGVVVNGVYQFDVAWPYLLVAFITLITGILWQIFVKGVWKNVSVLVGLAVGYIVSLCFIPYNGMVDFSAFTFNKFTDFINVPRPYFTLIEAKWGDFNIGAILTVLIIYIVATTENIGNISSLTDAGLGREMTGKELSGGLAACGFISCLAGFFGAMPLTSYAQNVGIVGQTKVANRFVILQTALLLFIASLFPPITTFLMTIPKPVLGGTMLMLFASIAVIGMQMIAKVGFTKKNIMILSLALGLGYGITLVPEFTAYEHLPQAAQYLMLILQNPVANMFLISLLLSYVIPERINGEDKKPESKVEEPVEETKESDEANN